MFRHSIQRSVSIVLRAPLIVIVLAFTAIPIEVQPLTRQTIRAAFRAELDVADLVTNVLGYIPFGFVFASRGPWVTAGVAASVSVFAETTQLFSKSRAPAWIDVTANVLGAMIGLELTKRWKREWRIRPPVLDVGRAKAFFAAALALGYVGYGARVTPLQVEDTVRSFLKTPRLLWLVASPRGSTVPGRLEAQWTFENISDGVIIDVSGNGLDGRVVNAPTVNDGIHGRSLTLNGVNQYVDVGRPTALQFTGSETISAWIRASSFPVDDAAVVSDHSGLGYQLDTTVDTGTRTIGFKLADAGGRLMARYGKTTLALNEWYHIAGVYDAQAKTLNVYLNGKRDDGCLLGRVTDRQRLSGMNTYIGRRASASGFEFAGSLDDVRIYSRALTPSEIEADFRSTPGAQSIRAAADVVSYRGDTTCPKEEAADSRTPGLVAALGLLVAVALAGLLPTTSRLTLCLASTAAGLLLFDALDPSIPSGYRWFLPLLTLAGGASIAFSIRPREAVP